jgi:O-methyltransferase
MNVARFRNRVHRALMRMARHFEPPVPATDKPWQQLGLDENTEKLWEAVRPRTMTSIQRLDALRQGIEYIHSNSIPGDIVECGVWRGGSMLAAALTLQRLDDERRLWLFDTFAGMPPPSSEDKDYQGRSAAELMAAQSPETSWIWAKSSLEDVKAGFEEIDYPRDLINYIVGNVEATIPIEAPENIALLRLDTDWYTSTYHELLHLWPRISKNGLLIIDDYGDWRGARKAVDQYFNENKLHPFLHRIDGTGRLIIKI